MESYFWWMIGLTLIIIALQSLKYCHHKPKDSKSTSIQQSMEQIENDKAFKSFQFAFVIIFLTALFSDWVLGAYQYDLYKAYLSDELVIARLYICAFAASAISCLFMGSFADVFGRKKMCLLFCILYATASMLKHSNNYNILLLSSMISGVSDSILLSCFEAWMVTEHHTLGFDTNLLSSTFEIAWGLNSIIAIISGFVGWGGYNFYKSIKQNNADNDVVNAWIKTPQLAVIDVSIFCLIITFFLILKFWKHENYGDSTVSMKQSFKNSIKFIFVQKPKVLFLCLLQCSFEGALFIFVTKWDPTLSGSCDKEINVAMLFVVFMMACLLGTSLDAAAANYKWYNAEMMAALVSMLSSVSFVGVRKKHNYEWNLLCFVVFEICVGVYLPIICGLRERYIEDQVRATVTNLFRLPINVIVIVGLLHVKELDDHIFTALSCLCAIGMLSALALAFDGYRNEEVKTDELDTELTETTTKV